MSQVVTSRSGVEAVLAKALAAQPIVDLHTHLYGPAFGTPDANATGRVDPKGLMLWGVDELVTYHYLVAEVFRAVPAAGKGGLPYEKFWKMSKQAQADHIWKHLFVERTPISESCRGVLTCLGKLGLDAGADKDLGKLRKWFSQQDPSKYIDKVMEISKVESITMTNNPFDDNERNRWLADPANLQDSRFTGVLRVDPIICNWPAAAKKMAEWGYKVTEEVSGQTIEEGRRFFREWIDRVKAIYVAASTPPEFRYPAQLDDPTAVASQIALEKIVLPVCAEKNIPLALMIGCYRGVNPALGDAGDMLGHADVLSMGRLCAAFPENRFMLTMLSRENQHEMAILARKFGNLMIFGCWWFLNNPSLIEEITRMRLELLGTTMIPQHSDARVLDQLVYKWEHSRQVIGKVLADKYADTIATGWRLTEEDVKKDVDRLFRGNFKDFLAR